MLFYTSRFFLGFPEPDAPSPPYVVAYLRSRPSEGAASEEAMSVQREVLADMTGKGEIVIVAEFVEEEDGHDELPAYRAAYREAAAQGCALLIAGSGAIGAGRSFDPSRDTVMAGEAAKGSVETIDVSISYVRFADLVPVPDGIPATIALWADYRPRQGVTGLYLCNGGFSQMDSVDLASATFELGFNESFSDSSLTVEPVPAGMARLLTQLFHNDWTSYSNYRLSYAADGTLHGPLVASDGTVNSEWLAEDPSKVWARFRPAASSPAVSDAATR